jgi:uroporphyrinogen III methyltransferase/synthase
LENLPVFSRELIRAGLAPTTPAAAIMWGTTARQRTCVATLAELPGKVRAEGFGAPVLTIVGRVVSRIGLFDSAALREPSPSLAQEA